MANGQAEQATSITEPVTKDGWTDEETQDYLDYLETVDAEIEAAIATLYPSIIDERLAQYEEAEAHYLDELEAQIEGAAAVQRPVQDEDDESRFLDGLEGAFDVAEGPREPAPSNNRAVRHVVLLGRKFPRSLFSGEQEGIIFDNTRTRLRKAVDDAAKAKGDNAEAKRAAAEAALRVFHLNWKIELSRRACQGLIDEMDDGMRESAQLILDDLCDDLYDDNDPYADKDDIDALRDFRDRDTAIAFGALTEWLYPTLGKSRDRLLAMRPKKHVKRLRNAIRKGARQCNSKSLSELPVVPADLVAACMALVRPMALIDLSGMDEGDGAGRSYTLGVYVDPRDKHIYTGKHAAERHRKRDNTYDISEKTILSLAKRFAIRRGKKFVEEVVYALDTFVSPTAPFADERYAFAQNCIVERATGRTFAYDPSFVVLHKSPIRYIPHAPEPAPWRLPDGSLITFDGWLDDVFSAEADAAMHELAWEVLSAATCPHLSTERVLLFISAVGMNGKGTVCGLLKSIVGPDVFSQSLDQLGEAFMLTEAVGMAAIISDESDVGAYSSKNATLKALVTGDALSLNRKHRDPITFRQTMFMAFCLNGMPQSQDKSNSLLRRILAVPFNKSFIGRQDKGIAKVWLKRQDLLEYVYAKAVTWDWDGTFCEPRSCKELLAEVRLENDPVLRFVACMLDDHSAEFDLDNPCASTLTACDFIKLRDAYDLYKSWFSYSHPSGRPLGLQAFKGALRAVLAGSGWAMADERGHARGALYGKRHIGPSQTNSAGYIQFEAVWQDDTHLRCHLYRTRPRWNLPVLVPDAYGKAAHVKLSELTLSTTVPDHAALRAAGLSSGLDGDTTNEWVAWWVAFAAVRDAFVDATDADPDERAVMVLDLPFPPLGLDVPSLSPVQ